ncbi:GGDEF domain-containing protein [Caldinitratiruptor microaerophilus]|uniref:GGDEF domain-containing protein n=1 Tax=Caldinitratiruptor microaerophilus TaxID=671077 RepID=A0AA35G907_9FIRM|nr:GGDEF domain-containing protein [Caldinitratiruptor microaerophilus]BDG61610.1 hypothetical protein caldi_27000 [Caldinitratiruptor microaerophilus]
MHVLRVVRVAVLAVAAGAVAVGLASLPSAPWHWPAVALAVAAVALVPPVRVQRILPALLAAALAAVAAGLRATLRVPPAPGLSGSSPGGALGPGALHVLLFHLLAGYSAAALPASVSWAAGPFAFLFLAASMERWGPGHVDLSPATALYLVSLTALALGVRSAVIAGQQVHRHMEQLRRQADTDFLTGLANHRSIYRRLHSEVERALASGRPLSVLLLDLDRFKSYNDTYGHLAGDSVLRSVGRALREACRGPDEVPGRYGGDEFLVVLPGKDAQAALEVAERIVARLAQERLPTGTGRLVALGASVGVAALPRDGSTATELIAAADAAMYAQKARSHAGAIAPP